MVVKASDLVMSEFERWKREEKHNWSFEDFIFELQENRLRNQNITYIHEGENYTLPLSQLLYERIKELGDGDYVKGLDVLIMRIRNQDRRMEMKGEN